jgi:hypothetical protein
MTSACRSSSGEAPQMRLIRFRTLGCYPLSGGIESNATTVEATSLLNCAAAVFPSARADS